MIAKETLAIKESDEFKGYKRWNNKGKDFICS